MSKKLIERIEEYPDGVDVCTKSENLKRLVEQAKLATSLEARNKVLTEALAELVDIVQGHLDDGEVLDSFTLQVAQAALKEER